MEAILGVVGRNPAAAQQVLEIFHGRRVRVWPREIHGEEERGRLSPRSRVELAHQEPIPLEGAQSVSRQIANK